MAKKKAGRPLAAIDWETVRKLAAIACTVDEVAGVIGVSHDTLERASKRVHKKAITEYMAPFAAAGNASLRRRQWQAAMDGDRTMLVWLGKQRLGQVDSHHQKISGDPDNPTPVVLYLPDNGKARKDG